MIVSVLLKTIITAKNGSTGGKGSELSELRMVIRIQTHNILTHSIISETSLSCLTDKHLHCYWQPNSK